jgi:hypothetical protein
LGLGDGGVAEAALEATEVALERGALAAGERGEAAAAAELLHGGLGGLGVGGGHTL